MGKVIKIGANTLRRLIKEEIEKHISESQASPELLEKAEQIKNKLLSLNMEKRGHSVKVYNDDGYDIQVGISGNMNVPAIADCKMVAEEFGCEGEYDRSWGVFTIYVQ
jgi:hypothetical protein